MKVLILAATGKMGGGTVKALKGSPHELYGFTRDAASAKAEALKSSGVTIFEGDFADRESLDRALAVGIDSVFFTIFPDLAGGDSDLKQTKNIIAAVKAAGVKQLIYGSLIYPGTEEGFRSVHDSLEPTSWIKLYFNRKLELDQLVRDSGVQYWTIIRPPTFIQNHVLPESIAFIYPDLASKYQFKSTWDHNLPQWYADGSEAGKFAAAAVNDPERLHTKEIKFASEALTAQQIVDKLAKASGKPVTLYQWPEEELKEALATNPFHNTTHVISKMGFDSEIGNAEKYGVELTPISEWLETNKKGTWLEA
ncbi:hypothetical protein TWF730_003837 [Orbilia blumenaviensis]|uniref:NmrA-like domain-containing protein n=1 Tax=Orbilia blumenaviensis TaxID=1796055 RepID=A0AAV9U1A1_9PEZI